MAHKTSRRTLLQGAGALALGAFASPALAAGYPDRPVRIIVPFSAGGPSDLTARTLGAKFTDALGQTFVVENKPGAGSNLGTAMVARSAPDGYTLLVTSSAFVVNPSLYKQVPVRPDQGRRAGRRVGHLAQRVHRHQGVRHHLDQGSGDATPRPSPTN